MILRSVLAVGAGLLAAASAVPLQQETDPAPTPSLNVLLRMTDESAEDWEIIDDRRMLGRSRSEFHLNPEDASGSFTGTVKPSRGGGWCSVRRTFAEPVDLSDASVMVLHVRGDGRTYGFNLRDNKSLAGAYYEAPFATTAGEWQDVELPIADFKPLSFGSPDPDATPLRTGRIHSVAFVIAQGQTGDFHLEIESISWR
jgi:hypothetical protein